MVALVALRDPHTSGTSPGTRTVTQSVPVTAPRSSPSTSPSKRASTSSAGRPAQSSSGSSSGSSSAAGLIGALPLKVLNDTHTANLATQAGDAFKVGGWTVTSVDEGYSNNILSTAAYYDPSVSNAKAVAEALQQQFPAIKRVVPKFSGLTDGPIVVILTADYTPS